MRLSLCLIALCFAGSACNCGKPGGGSGSGAGGGAGGTGGGGSLGDGGVTACINGATAITVTGTQAVTLTGTPSPIAFTATATTSSGMVDVTHQVDWSVMRSDDTPPGAISSSGSFTPTAAGGVVTVTATDGCLTGSTTVTFTLNVTFNDPGATVTGRFNGTVVTGSTTKAPLIVYPNTETRFPINIYKVLFQWRKQGNDYFRLTFQGANSKIVVYSDGAHPQCAAATPPAGCYEATAVTWAAIAGSNAGGVVDLTIDGVTAADPNVYSSASIKIGFSKRAVKGAIFYWSTTAQGVRRASVSDAAPEDYVVAKPVATVLPHSGAVKCVACHTVSRSGKKMVAASDTAGGMGIFAYDVTLQPPPNDYITTGVGGPGHEFGTISPDDKRAVATKAGAMAEYDISGAGPAGPKVADLPLGTKKATHPDWSPKGTELAFTTVGGGMGPMGGMINDTPANASIAVIAYDAGVWGAIRTLVPSDGGTNLFPSYSPEGDYVAYSRGTKGGHDDLTAQLFVIKADGTGGTTGVELVKANRWVNNTVTLGQFENNQPTWAPPGDLQWVAFNSLRPYGVVFPTGGTQQIWVAAVDPAMLAAGNIDPSWPAFRFAFQGLNENNHRAFWTLDVRVPDDGGVFIEVPGSGDGGLPDGGMCLAPVGTVCDQTAGAPCCGSLVCDVNPDGGANVCTQIVIN